MKSANYFISRKTGRDILLNVKVTDINIVLFAFSLPEPDFLTVSKRDGSVQR